MTAIVNQPKVSLVVFSCEGRGHLLGPTINSFKDACDFKFEKTIMAVDGYLEHEYIASVSPDKTVQNVRRSGYIHSILNALSLVDTEYFFWLEEDWEFSRPVDLQGMLSRLKAQQDWVQVRLSKTGPLTAEEKVKELSGGIFESIYGFSANPCLCRTEHVKAGMKALFDTSREKRISFEEFLTDWFKSDGKVCAVEDPGEKAAVNHTGYLESTPRQWLMTASLAGETDEYVSGFHSGAPPLWRRLLMTQKLLASFLRIATRQFISQAAYDLAFRINIMSKEGSE
jgi:hypothetical protein